MRCIECGAEMIVSNDPIVEVFRGEKITVEGVEHYLCPACGEMEFDADTLDEWSAKIDAAYRRTKGLLSPSEIRAVRKLYGLTQEQFEQVLGVGPISATRWERGKVVQNKTVDTLIRIMRDNPRIARGLIEDAGIDEKCESGGVKKEWRIVVPNSRKVQYV